MQGLVNAANLGQKAASVLFKAVYQWNENK